MGRPCRFTLTISMPTDYRDAPHSTGARYRPRTAKLPVVIGDPKQKLDLESPMAASQRERSIASVLRTLATGRKQPTGTASSSQHGPSRLISLLNLHGLD